MGLYWDLIGIFFAGTCIKSDCWAFNWMSTKVGQSDLLMILSLEFPSNTVGLSDFIRYERSRRGLIGSGIGYFHSVLNMGSWNSYSQLVTMLCTELFYKFDNCRERHRGIVYFLTFVASFVLLFISFIEKYFYSWFLNVKVSVADIIEILF